MALAVLHHQASLIHGLPNDVVLDEILSRVASNSWWDSRSLRAVSRAWRSSVEGSDSPRKMFGAIHRFSSSPLTLAVSVFDPHLNTWETLPPLPAVPCGAPLSARCICVDGKLYVLGGRVFPGLAFLDRVFSMDLRAYKREWKECPRMRLGRSGFACAEWKGKIVVAGGQSRDSIAVSSVEIFDPRTGCWELMPEMELPRAECTGAVSGDGRLCVIGGYTIHPEDEEQTVWVDVSEVLDESCGEWEMRFEEEELGEVVVSSGSLSRVGGSSSSRGRIRAAGDSGSVLLTGIAREGEEYATRSEIDEGSGRVMTSLWRKKNPNSWEEIQLPFDLLPTVSCCYIEI